MPFVCKFCKGRYCAAHRLPENHGCQGLGAYQQKMRTEGRIMRPEPDLVQPRMSTTARASMSMSSFWSRVDGKMTWIILGVTIATYVLQWIVALAAPGLYSHVFPIEMDFWREPWTLVTSTFSHSLGDPWHIVLNMLVLVFFGRVVEQLVGTRRFTALYLATGAIAGVAQVLFSYYVFDDPRGALGASGALQGLTGVLVVLAPRLTVLVFGIIPAPMWAVGTLYVFLDAVGVLNPGSNVGHAAHLAGFAIGAAYAYSLKKKGLRVYTRPPPREPSMTWR